MITTDILLIINGIALFVMDILFIIKVFNED